MSYYQAEGSHVKTLLVHCEICRIPLRSLTGLAGAAYYTCWDCCQLSVPDRFRKRIEAATKPVHKVQCACSYCHRIFTVESIDTNIHHDYCCPDCFSAEKSTT